MNFARPSSPSAASAPALSRLQQGSSSGTSSREGARLAPCGRLLKPARVAPALCRLEFRRLMMCSSAENGLEGSKSVVIIAMGETCSVYERARARAVVRAGHRSAVSRNDAVSDGCPETVCVFCADQITDVQRGCVTCRLCAAPHTFTEHARLSTHYFLITTESRGMINKHHLYLFWTPIRCFNSRGHSQSIMFSLSCYISVTSNYKFITPAK